MYNCDVIINQSIIRNDAIAHHFRIKDTTTFCLIITLPIGSLVSLYQKSTEAVGKYRLMPLL